MVLFQRVALCAAGFAAWLLRIPVVAHESDLTPGANRLAAPFVKTFCTSFADTGLGHFRGRVKHTGFLIRPELVAGDGKGDTFARVTRRYCLYWRQFRRRQAKSSRTRGTARVTATIYGAAYLRAGQS